MFQVGSIVKWKTRPYEPEKSGEIIGFIPAGVSPTKAVPSMKGIPTSRCQFGYGKEGASKFDRYIVRVDRIGAKGQPLASVFYSPAATTVEAQNNA